jgi:hypothetical protein
VSDETDSFRNQGNASSARVGGAGANLDVPDRSTSAGTDPCKDPYNKNGNPGKHDLSDQKEIGGKDGPNPTRFGDWEIKGRCIDF